MSPVVVVAQVIVAGGLAGARPALTLCLLQVYVAVLAAESLPPDLLWTVNGWAIAAVGLAALVEHFARTDPDLDELLELPNKAIGALSGVVVAALLVALRTGAGLDPGADEPGAEPGLLHAGLVADLRGSTGLLVLSAVCAVATGFVVGWARRRILSALDLMAVPSRAVRWVETGTVAGALALVLLLPILAVALAAVVVVGSTTAGLIVRGVERRRDELSRVACVCGREVRVEALLCPTCGRELEPRRRLDRPRRTAADPGPPSE